MSFLFRVSHQFSLMLLPSSPISPNPLPHGHFPYAAPPATPRIPPPPRCPAFLRLFVWYPMPGFWYFLPSYMTLYYISISVFYVLSEYSPLYRTLMSYPNDNLIFLSAALMLYRISCTNKYPSYSSILCTYVCPLYAAYMSYPFYRLCSDTRCDLHTRITAPDDYPI